MARSKFVTARAASKSDTVWPAAVSVSAKYWAAAMFGKTTTLALVLLFSSQLNVALRTVCICGLTASGVIAESQATIALLAGVGAGTPTNEFGTSKLCAQ